LGFTNGEDNMVTIDDVLKLWEEKYSEPDRQIEAQGYGKQEGEPIREGKPYGRLNQEMVIKLSEEFDFEPWNNRTCYVFGFNYKSEIPYEIYIRFERRVIWHSNTDSLYKKLESIKKAESNLKDFVVSKGRINPNHLVLGTKLNPNSSAKVICDCMKKLIDSTQEKIYYFLTGKRKQKGKLKPQKGRLNRILVKHEVKDEKQRRKCEEIYNIAEKISKLLLIKDLGSLKASYYTQKKIATDLLIKSKETESKETGKCNEFRLYYTSEMNDPSEGEVLLNFLEIKNENRAELPENIPFIACFSLEENSLNQFRLYGKEDDKEATGVSIIFGYSFFENYDFYRCVYINREGKFKVSFSKEETDNKTQKIEKLFKRLKESYKELCKISKEDIKPKLMVDLLIKIIYLVKDRAFEEERECRIVYLKNKKDKNREPTIKIDGNRLYIIKKDTDEIINHIEKIYFAPLTEGIEAFEIKTGVKKCIRSLHPYRGKQNCEKKQPSEDNIKNSTN